MSFINKYFLLRPDPTHRLYHDYAIDCPTHDYHSHLDPVRILDNTPFENFTTIGMVADPRGFRSYSCHGYFRRVFFNFPGEHIETGDIPNDFDLAGELVRDLSYRNAAGYFGFESI